MTDFEFMELALVEAEASLEHDDVPVGAVVVRHGEVIASRHNERELSGDPTAHAEVLALRDAASVVGTWYLSDCTLYATLEPCSMCAGALVLSRIQKLVFGAADKKAGACGSLFNICNDSRLNHRLEVFSGVQAERCSILLKTFFAELRNR